MTPGRRERHRNVTLSSEDGASMVQVADSDERPEVLVYVVDAGGGHRAAANALVAAAQGVSCPFRLTVASLQSVLEPLDLLRRATGLPVQDAYNALLRTRRTIYLVPLLRLLQLSIRARRGALVSSLSGDLRRRRPKAVLSVVPNFNGVIRDAVHATLPGTPFVVALTDFADFPPHFWIEPGVTKIVAGTEKAVDQALELGVPEERVFRSSGMILHPRFYSTPAADRQVLKRRLGLDPVAPVALVMFGGKGSAEMPPLVTRLLALDQRVQVVALCGDNPRLVDSMNAVRAAGAPRLHPMGFTDRVVEYLGAADVLLTKPGPGALAEAFHKGVPVVVPRSRHTIPQERYNADFVAEKGLGLVVASEAEMPSAAVRLLGDDLLRERTRAALARLPCNSAVFQVLELLARETLHEDAGSAPPRTRRRLRFASLWATPPRIKPEAMPSRKP